MFCASFGITHRQTCNRKYTKTASRSRILKSGLQLSSVIRQLHIATRPNHRSSVLSELSWKRLVPVRVNRVVNSASVVR